MQISSRLLDAQEYLSAAWIHRAPVRFRVALNSKISGETIDAFSIGSDILDPVGSVGSAYLDGNAGSPVKRNAIELDYI